MFNPTIKAGGARAAVWLFSPLRPTTSTVRARLLGQLSDSAPAAILAAVCAMIVLAVAVYRSGDATFVVLLAAEFGLLGARMVSLYRQRHGRSLRGMDDAGVTGNKPSVLLTLAWCLLQGTTAFVIISGEDTVLKVLAATFVMATIGPLCARNYPAPRYAMLLVLLIDLPFVAGAIVSGEPALLVIIPMTPPFLAGTMQILVRFHTVLLAALTAEEENMRQARQDALTGILNRKGMDDRLVALEGGNGRTMALLSIDLDGFKQINDRYGHGAGDIVLIAVADRIRGATRADDWIARVGGDEFMVVLPGLDAGHVARVAAGVLDAISDAPITLADGTSVSIGASIGYACLPDDARGTADLRLRADRALYDAKETGKGTCRRCVDWAA